VFARDTNQWYDDEVSLTPEFDAITAAVAAAGCVDLDALGPIESSAALRSLKQAASRLDALVARLTHHVDLTGAVVGTGSRDAADWLARQTGTSAHKNRVAGQLGAAMSRSDELSEAVSSGSISSEQAAVLAIAAADEAVDAELLEQLADLPLSSVKPTVETWRAKKHPDRDADVAKVQRSKRYLRLSEQPNGMTRVDGLLDPQSASIVRTTLDSIVNDSAFDDTGRTREQRQSDALTQLCTAASKGEITGGRSNAKLLVSTTYEALCERASTRGHTNVGNTIDAVAVRQLACDAGIHRVITGPGSSILEFGRQTRLVTDNQFCALVVRDRHCRWPGCTIRATWCDAHHIVEWSAGGDTDLGNLALFCHHHHHLGHQPGWAVVGTAERIQIHHPDGRTDTSTPPGTTVTGTTASGTSPPRCTPPRADTMVGREPSHGAAPAAPHRAAPAQLVLVSRDG